MGTQREADSRSISSAVHIESLSGTDDAIESVPGTHMIELPGLHPGHDKTNSHSTILVPRPSANPTDPLVRSPAMLSGRFYSRRPTELEQKPKIDSRTHPRSLRSLQHFAYSSYCPSLSRPHC